MQVKVSKINTCMCQHLIFSLHVPSSFFPSSLRSLDMTMNTPREFMVQFLVCDIQIMDWSSHHMLG